MSRRSRKRGSSGGAGWLGKAALALVVVGLVAAAVLYGMVRSYLHSDGFRKFLSAKASEVAKVEGQFSPFRWDGLAVNTSGFDAAGDGFLKSMKMEGLHTEVGLGGLGRGVWEIQSSRVQRIELDVAVPPADPTAGLTPPVASVPSEPSAPKARPSKSWLPSEVEIQGVDVGELIVKAALPQGTAQVDGVRLRMEPGTAKGAYQIEAADGSIRLPLPLIPELRLDRAKLRYQDGDLFINRFSASAWENGRIEASGEWNLPGKRYALQGDITGVKCEDLFNEDWAKRFIGNVESDFTVENHSGELVARGSMKILDGTLTALPVLDALAAYADTRRFRVLSLTEASTDWRWKKGEIFLSKFVLGSEGLIHLEGSLYIRGDALDGTFRLGLAPGTLAKIPGAETDVFLPGERGLVWAPLRVSGTLDDPKEDLTDRLVAAAGLRMFDVIPETGEKVIRFSRSILGDSPAKVVDKGVKIIEDSRDVVEGVGGIIDGFFGNSRREENPIVPPKEDP